MSLKTIQFYLDPQTNNPLDRRVAGPSTNRPDPQVSYAGLWRYETDTNTFAYYDGTNWQQYGGQDTQLRADFEQLRAESGHMHAGNQVAHAQLRTDFDAHVVHNQSSFSQLTQFLFTKADKSYTGSQTLPLTLSNMILALATKALIHSADYTAGSGPPGPPTAETSAGTAHQVTFSEQFMFIHDGSKWRRFYSLNPF